jgi:rod shape-determining protein MreD
MIITWRIGVRIAFILVVAIVLQVSFFSYLTILGSVPDVVPVVVVALGLLGGGVVGAVCGFAGGFLLDSMLLQTLGVSSLALLSIGYLAGRYRESFEITNSLVPPLLAGGFTALGTAAFAAVQLMLGVETPVSLLVVREILVQALLAILLAVPVYPLIRRIVRPALIDDTRSTRLLAPASVRRGRVGSRMQRRPGAGAASATVGRRFDRPRGVTG